MKGAKPTSAMILVSILAMAAGLVVGAVLSRFPTASAAGADRSPLTEELQLSDSQRLQMKQIWEQVRDTAHECQQQAQQLQKQRDDSVFALLNDAQKNRYTQLSTECLGKIQALNAKREAAFQDAVGRTKLILSDSQRRTYEQMIKSRLGMQASGSTGESPAEEASLQR